MAVGGPYQRGCLEACKAMRVSGECWERLSGQFEVLGQQQAGLKGEVGKVCPGP